MLYLRFTSLVSLLLITFVLPAQPANDLRASVQVQATVNATDPAIQLEWLAYPEATGYTIYRRLVADATAWGTPIATLEAGATGYVDNTVAVGQLYEYRVLRSSSNGNGNGYLHSGIELPAAEDRGTLLLLIDDRFTTSLASELELMMHDLEMDGWQVEALHVSPDSSVAYVKNLISTNYASAPEQMKGVWLLGHIAVPYSGNLGPDGHNNHIGAWPADVFYGEMDGNWSDNTVNNTTAAQARNHNVPGDGKYDQTVIPGDVELMVGRVDFHSLPAFTETEEELLRRYILKNHAFKHRAFVPLRRGLIENNFGGFAEAFGQNGLKNFVPAVGADSTFYRDFNALRTGSYLFSYGCGGGNYTGAGGISNTNNFANDSLQGVFTMLFGSYFGDWDSNNNFLRAALASGTILSNAWAGRPNWAFHPLAMGASTGYCARLTQNNPNFSYESGFGNRNVHVALMGDPTLRLFMVEPPADLVLTENDGHVTLAWEAPGEPVLGYYVYRKAATGWERLHDTPVVDATFTDSCRAIGNYQYLVKSLQLEQTASGSYYNLSLGVTDSIRTTTDLSVLADFTITNQNDGSIQLLNQSQGALDYQWILSNGVTVTEVDPLIDDLLDGELTVTLVASNACRSDTLTQSILVTDNQELTEEADFRVFPNPARDYIRIEYRDSSPSLVVELWQADGQLLLQRPLRESPLTLSIGAYPAGTYTLVLRSGEQQLRRIRFLKQ